MEDKDNGAKSELGSQGSNFRKMLHTKHLVILEMAD